MELDNVWPFDDDEGEFQRQVANAWRLRWAKDGVRRPAGRDILVRSS